MKVYFYVHDANKPVAECDIEFNRALDSYIDKKFKEGKEYTEHIQCDEFFLYSFLDCAFNRNEVNCYNRVPDKLYSVWQAILDTDTPIITVKILYGNFKKSFILNTKFLEFTIDAKDFIKHCETDFIDVHHWKTPTKRTKYTIDANANITVLARTRGEAEFIFTALWKEFINHCDNITNLATTVDCTSNYNISEGEQ